MKIAIIGGAGTLGSAVAYELGKIELVDEICLIDINERLVKNHIMDLVGAYPRKQYYFGDYKELSDSEIVIITAGVPNRNDVENRDVFLEGNIKLFKQFGKNIKKYAPNALIITASNPVDVLNYFLYKTFNFNKGQLLGYSLNDSYRFERAIRQALNISAEIDVKSPVIGEHGDKQVPLFSQVEIDHQNQSISDSLKRKIKYEIQAWFTDFNKLQINRTTGWMTAKGIGTLVSKLVEKKEFITIGSAIMNGEYKIKDVSLGNTIIMDNFRIKKIVELQLSNLEMQGLNQASDKIKKIINH